MKFKLLSLSIGILLSQCALADMPPKPQACPSFSSLLTVTFDSAWQTPFGWVSLKNGSYGTADNWTFVMLSREAKNKEDAIEQANANIFKLTRVKGPETKRDSWACTYTNEDETIAGGTITPSIFNLREIWS